MARRYRFSANNGRQDSPTGATTAMDGRGGYPSGGGVCEEVANSSGVPIDPDCCHVPKQCNWRTLPGCVIGIAPGTTAPMTVVSLISPFFDIHAASLVVVNADECTLNGRALLKGVAFNSRQLEDYAETAGLADDCGVLIDAGYQFDNPTAVNWMAGTSGNNYQLVLRIKNICSFPISVYGVFYGNPCDNCPA